MPRSTSTGTFIAGGARRQGDTEMKFLNIDTIAMFLLMIAGLNAGVSAVFDYDVLGQVISGGVSTVFYALVGLSAVYALADRMGVIGSHE
jgi:uncharacterized membrane protein YuzA (DUF378 family)